MTPSTLVLWELWADDRLVCRWFVPYDATLSLDPAFLDRVAARSGVPLERLEWRFVPADQCDDHAPPARRRRRWRVAAAAGILARCVRSRGRRKGA